MQVSHCSLLLDPTGFVPRLSPWLVPHFSTPSAVMFIINKSSFILTQFSCSTETALTSAVREIVSNCTNFINILGLHVGLCLGLLLSRLNFPMLIARLPTVFVRENCIVFTIDLFVCFRICNREDRRKRTSWSNQVSQTKYWPKKKTGSCSKICY